MKIMTRLMIILWGMLLSACAGDAMIKDSFSYGSLEKMPPEQWERLGQEKIFFGHKSVGNNILEGMETILEAHPEIRLTIMKTDDPAEIQPGRLAHAAVGKNGDPQSKIRDFAAKMRSGIGGKTDIAFFKFCYVDITSATDVQAVFAEYRDTMAGLKTAYPQTTFIHVTTPLMWRQLNTPKGMLKRLLGRGGEADNAARHAYNELLRTEYQGKEPLFDLARLESIGPDGTVASFTWKGTAYPALVPEYTDDGGHLSPAGKTRMAEQLLVYLAGLK